MKTMSPYPYNLLDDIFGEDYDGILDADQLDGFNYAIGSLTEREQRVLSLYYKDELTLEQAGKSEGVTRERIRQVLAKSLRKLRHPTRLKYIQRGYKILSGELEQQIADRYSEALKQYELEYIKKITELQKKIANADKILEKTNIEECEEFIGSIMTPIENIDLSVRSYNCLARAGIKNIGQICGMTYDELCHIRNLGRKSVEEIISKLNAYGLRLKDGELNG